MEKDIRIIYDISSGKEIPLKWKDIKKGMTIRIYESPEELLGDYIALSDSYKSIYNNKKVWTFNTSKKLKESL